MRPVDKKYKIGFGFKAPYPPNLAHLTADGLHHGIDVETPLGTPVIASINGLINKLIYNDRYMGNAVYIKFWSWFRTYRTVFLHLSMLKPFKIGDKVKKTDIIGLTGESGTFYEGRNHPHLHFQTDRFDSRIGLWIPIDPKFVFGEA